MTHFLKKLVLGGLVVLLASGCGWQLRGSKNIASNINALSVVTNKTYGPLARALEQEMKLQHISDQGEQAWSLQILSERMRSNTIAFSDTNNAAMAEMELEVRFTATNDKGEMVIAPNTERVVRLYEVNNDRRLASDRETRLLEDEVYREMANNLLRRVDFVAGQK